MQLPYRYTLDFINEQKDKNGLKVFSLFCCGGGSSFGYKMAGCTVLGGVEIDHRVAECYIENHKPIYFYNEDVRDFNKREELPSDLYNLDILDASPPCSLFSLAGDREKKWGKETKFREGQKVQTLDDLFFHTIETVKKLRPKVFVFENVKAMLAGNAKTYTRRVITELKEAGYETQIFLINAMHCGVPQRRERVFFIGYDTKRFSFPKLTLEFNEKPIPFREIYTQGLNDSKFSPICQKYWGSRSSEDDLMSHTYARVMGLTRVEAKAKYFGYPYAKQNEVLYTLMGKNGTICYDEPRFINKTEICLAGSWPLDYNFVKQQPIYLIGMSVPPTMSGRVAQEIVKQWFKI